MNKIFKITCKDGALGIPVCEINCTNSTYSFFKEMLFSTKAKLMELSLYKECGYSIIEYHIDKTLDEMYSILKEIHDFHFIDIDDIEKNIRAYYN